MNKNTYIIELNYTTYLGNYDDEAVYFAESKRITIEEVLDFVKNTLRIDQTIALKKLVLHKDFDKDILHDFILDIEEIEEEKTMLDEEFVKFYELDIINALDESYDFEKCLYDYIKFIDKDLTIGSAGYSDWCEFITTKPLYKYAQDLYEGSNFYDIEIYNNDSVFFDAASEIYITDEYFNENYILQCVKDYFGIELETLNLIDNEASEYLKMTENTKLFTKEWHYKLKERSTKHE